MTSSLKYVKHLILSLIKFYHSILVQTQKYNRSAFLSIPAFILFLSSLIFPNQSMAQFYDTIHRPKLGWFEIRSEHFRVIYHEGLDDLAQRAVNHLENRYPEIQNLIGGQLKDYPVIINGYNDSGNGYVSTLHFRMEIEAPPISGKILNHVGSDRLDGLLSHELTHALQFSEFGTKGFTRFISFFSPDVARSNHGLTPPGFREGLATHVESELNPKIGGRGNFAPFTNQFYQNINGVSDWNLAELLTPSTVYRPLNRYYIGGYHFTDWLIKTQKSDLIESSLKSFANFPLLGYAPHLWYHTGKSPRSLYREFIQFETQKFDSISAKRSSPANEFDSSNRSSPENEFDSSNRSSPANEFGPVGHSGPASHASQTSPFQIFENKSLNGSNSYNPIWVNDHQIIYYSTSYNGRPGFYTLDITDNSHTLLYETRIEESFGFKLSPDRKSLSFSRYHTHLIYDNYYITDVYEVDINSLETTRITKNDRVRIPEYINDSTLVALQTHADSHQPVIINISKSHSRPPYKSDITPFYFQREIPLSSLDNPFQSQTNLGVDSTSHSSVNYIQVSINPVYKTHYDSTSQKNKTALGDTAITVNGQKLSTNPYRIKKPPSLPYSAAIITADNQSGIYLSFDESIPVPSPTHEPAVHLQNSSIYDLSWSSDGKKLLFSADYQHAMQLFEYNTEQETLQRLTHGPWNSMEASYSVDGTKIAFISLESNQRKIVIQNYSDFSPEFVDSTKKSTFHASTLDNSINFAPSLVASSQGDYLLHSNHNSSQKTASEQIKTNKLYSSHHEPRTTNVYFPSVPYKTSAAWLIPRTFVPISNQISSNKARTIGLSLHSSDVLRKNAYALDLEFAQKSLFYDFKYRYTGFFPAIQLNLKQTAYNPGNLVQRDGLEFFGEQRDYGISTPMRFNIDHRNSSNSLIIIPEFLYQSSRVRLADDINPINNQITDWAESNGIRFFTAYNHRLKQNIRSIGPIGGLFLFYQADLDINKINSDLKPFSGHRAGIYFYSSPLKNQNHTLRLGLQSIVQNRFGYNTLNLIHEGFNYSDFKLVEKNFTTISTKYNIPLGYPDTGGILIPAYVESYYLTLFSESIINSQFQHLDSVIGIGFRGRFRFFYNIVFDVGIGVAFNPFIKGSETIVLNF